MDEEMLPKFNYYIDESDPDIVVLRRQDGSFAAAFSTKGEHDRGYRGGHQGRLQEVDRGARRLHGPSRSA